MNGCRRKRIALINQRYGLEVNGGSEYYTRQLAEHLCKQYDVEVLTSRSLDYFLWDNHFDQDVETINNVIVIRFDVERQRDPKKMERLEKRLHGRRSKSKRIAERWIDECGPLCPSLVDYIKKHADEYDAFVFVTYMYYPAIKGMPVVANKAVLVPTAHDDPYIAFPHYRPIFEDAHALAYLTDEEQRLVESMFDVARKPHSVIGCGVDIPEAVDNEGFRKKYGIEGNYIVYVGRIGPEKGCDGMIRAFSEYHRLFQGDDLKLVLMGRGEIPLPEGLPIKTLGFVSEQDKFNAISGASALWLPSQFESLSIAVLEALALGVPVLVNGKCEVLKGHCDKSHAGWAYEDEHEAATMLRAIMMLPNRNEVKDMAKRYIEEHYTWAITTSRLSSLIESVR